MKRLSILCLASALLALAPSARAEPRYLVYDLKTQKATPATVSDPRDATYRNGTQILFVQDPDISTDYYIGAFEVTQAQAATLKWTGAKAGGQAYTATTTTEISTLPALPPNLSFQTVAQWQAYAGEPTKPCNVSGGMPDNLSLFLDAVPVEDWYEGDYAGVTDPDHGAFDLYGNALEYTAEGLYIGGCAAKTGYTFSSLSKDGETIRDKGPTDRDGRGLLGVRLVYTPPEAQTFSVTVTMNGKQVGEPEGHKPGETVAVTPQVPVGHALMGREVTPAGLDGEAALDKAFTFEMPAQDVTVAYTSKPYATITVEGGTASVEGGQSGASVRAFAGDVVTLTAREPGDYETFAGWEAPEGVELGEGGVFTVPADIQGGEEYTFKATFKTIPYATITVVGGTASASEAVAGATVTLTPRAAGKYEKFAGWDAPEGITVKDNAFTVPTLTESVTYAFTARFETIPHATIVVVGGDASAYEAVAGETVTLTPREAPPYQAFTGWDGPEVKDNVFTVPADIRGGEEYVFTANYQYYPRVLVSGGTVTVTNGKQAFGNGYYEPGANLTLTPTEIEGRTFKGWAGATEGLTGDAYVVGNYGTTVTLTATYEDAEAETPDPVTIRLGSGASLFGNLPGEETEVGTDDFGNRYRGFHYSPAGTIASLNLTSSVITYSEPSSSGDEPVGDPPSRLDYDTYQAFWRDYLVWWQKAYGETETPALDTSVLALRRVVRDDGTAFYLGVYETTIGHVARLNGEKENLNSAKVYCGKNGSEFYPLPDTFNAILSTLNKKFKVKARLPKVTDVAEISPGYRYQDSPDETLTSDMVIAGGTGASPKDANAMAQDPYGFYGLWGNAFETNDEGNGFGGAVVLRPTADFSTEIIQPFDGGANAYAQYASFRPLIEVEEPVAIVVGASGGPVVHVAAGEKLFPDGSATPEPTQAGKKFTGWTLGGKAIDTAYTVRAEDAGKVLAATWADVPSATDITVTCENCLGPGSAVVGGTITVYPHEGYAFNEDKPITIDDTSKVVEKWALQDGAVTLTLEDGALDKPASLTITGNIVELAQPRPGYRLILR